jgi:hypothetical protein
MFKCEDCRNITNPCEKQHKVVVERRNRVYHYYKVEYRSTQGKKRIIYTENKDFATKKGNKILNQFKSKGWEIVLEKRVCEQCAKKTNS